MNEYQAVVCNADLDHLGGEMLDETWNKTESERGGLSSIRDVIARATAVDRPMNRLCRLMYASRGLHGHQGRPSYGCGGWGLDR